MATEHPLTLDQMRQMPLGEVANLNAVLLARLQEQAISAVEQAKLTKDFLDGVLTRRYADRADQIRKEAGKDSGSVRFVDDGVHVMADLPKKVDWNQQSLKEIVDRIRCAGEDPDEYVEITYKVAERKFTAWPQHTRRSFEAARTLKTGKPTFKLSLAEQETTR